MTNLRVEISGPNAQVVNPVNGVILMDGKSSEVAKALVGVKHDLVHSFGQGLSVKVASKGYEINNGKDTVKVLSYNQLKAKLSEFAERNITHTDLAYFKPSKAQVIEIVEKDGKYLVTDKNSGDVYKTTDFIATAIRFKRHNFSEQTADIDNDRELAVNLLVEVLTKNEVELPENFSETLLADSIFQLNLKGKNFKEMAKGNDVQRLFNYNKDMMVFGFTSFLRKN